MRAFEMFSRSREVEISQGPQGPVITPKKIPLTWIFEYMDRFPEDVDDPRIFIRTIQALDSEFIEYGPRKSQITS